MNPRNPEAQRFSRPSDSAALASLRRRSLGLAQWPPLGEEPAEEDGRLLAPDPRDDRHAVVQPGVSGQVVEAAAGPGLWIGGTEIDIPFDPGTGIGPPWPEGDFILPI